MLFQFQITVYLLLLVCTDNMEMKYYRGPSAFRPVSSAHNVRPKLPGSSSVPAQSVPNSAQPGPSSAKGDTQDARKSESPARPNSSPSRSSVSPHRPTRNSVSPHRTSQTPPTVTPRTSKQPSVPSTTASSSAMSSSHRQSSATTKLPSGGHDQHQGQGHSRHSQPSGGQDQHQGQGHSRHSQPSGASAMPSHPRKGNNGLPDHHKSNSSAPAPSVSHSVPNASGGIATGATQGATGESIPATGKDKVSLPLLCCYKSICPFHQMHCCHKCPRKLTSNLVSKGDRNFPLKFDVSLILEISDKISTLTNIK